MTKIGLPETSLGIIPGAGGTQRITRLLGASKAKDLIFTARTLSVKEAFELGMTSAPTVIESRTDYHIKGLLIMCPDPGQPRLTLHWSWLHVLPSTVILGMQRMAGSL